MNCENIHQDPLLEIKNLHVVYETDLQTVYAVNGINMTLYPGQALGLVGETGAGKTTTALSILRILPDKIGKVTDGEILFNGVNLLSLNDGKMRDIRGEEISMIFQDPMTSLNPIITVGDQIYESLLLHNKHRLSKKELHERVDEIMEMVGIVASRKGEYPHQFSGGMKQRIVIAMALACRPNIVIADEPTTALDVTIQAQVLAMMRNLMRELQTSVILITHDLGIVAENCDFVSVMYAGEIVESGTVVDIFGQSNHHPYTEGLIGSIPNLIVETNRLKPIYGIMPDPTNLPTGCKFHPRCPYCMEKCKTIQPSAHVNGSHIIACHLYDKGGITDD